LPVVVLPTVDLSKVVPPPSKQAAPTELATAIPHRRFGVRFTATRSDGKDVRTHGLLFIIHQPTSQGRLLPSVMCHMSPTAGPTAGTAVFEGICPRPRVPGPVLIEVRYLDKSCLVLSADVQ